MDVLSLFFGLIDFLKFLIPLTIISFVIFKLGSKIKDWLKEKYELTWMKSVLVINLVTIFVIIFFTYLYFSLLGGALTLVNTPDLSYDFFESIILLGVATIRIVIATIILSLVLLFFEFVASFIIDLQREKEYSVTIKEIIGIGASCALFLILLLSIFSWVPLGLFVYVFYGNIGELPLLLPLLMIIT